MSIATAILLLLEAEDGPVRGRTLLQKRLYFFSALTEQDMGFAPHYYGPYSSAVSTELDALVAAGIVLSTPVPIGASGPFGEIVRYDYSLAQPFRPVPDQLRGPDPDRYLREFQRIGSSRVARQVRALSAAAKIHFIVRSAGRVTLPELENRARQLGWELDAGQFSQVRDYLERHLDLVKVGG